MPSRPPPAPSLSDASGTPPGSSPPPPWASLVLRGAGLGAALALAGLLADAGFAAAQAPDLLWPDRRIGAALLALSAPVVALGAVAGAAGLALGGRLMAPLARVATPHRVGNLSGALVTVGALAGAGLLVASDRPPAWQPGAAGHAGARPGAPDVVFIVVDTLRDDALDDPRFGVDLAPRFHALAAGATRFTDVTATSSWTSTTTATLLTGRYPTHLDVHKKALPDTAVTLAESFHRAGYTTAAFTDNYLVSRQWGFGQGFETFGLHNHFLPIRLFAPYVLSHLLTSEKQGEAILRRFHLLYMGGEHVNTMAERWLDEHRDDPRPRFLYLHYMDVHYPYHLHPKDVGNVALRTGKEDRLWYGELLEQMHRSPPVARLELEPGALADLHTRYLGGVQHLDGLVGRMLDRLSQDPRWPASLLVVTADHGEEFLEHGLWGHGHALYQEQVRVPLLVRPPQGWGDDLWRGRRVDQPISTLQVAGTIAEVAGIDPPPDAAPGLAALLRGADGRVLPVRAETIKRGNTIRMARTGSLTAFRVVPDGGVPRYEVYDLQGDPAQTADLSARPDAAGALRAVDEFDAWVTGQGALQGREMGEAERERLRALGYVDD